MPSIHIKLASLSSSLKKSFKKVANKLSLKKKNRSGKKEKIFVVANEIQNEIEIAQPAAVVVAPFDVEKAKTFLMVSTFGLDEDEEDDEDEEEEEIFGDVRDFESEKNAIVSVVPKSIVAAVSERSKLCLHVQLIKSSPKAKGPPRLRSFKPQPSPLRNVVVVAPPSLPSLDIATTTSTETIITTPPPLSPSSSLSSIKSSSSSDNDNGPSTPPRNASPTRSSVVQKRVSEIEARCGRE